MLYLCLNLHSCNNLSYMYLTAVYNMGLAIRSDYPNDSLLIHTSLAMSWINASRDHPTIRIFSNYHVTKL